MDSKIHKFGLLQATLVHVLLSELSFPSAVLLLLRMAIQLAVDLKRTRTTVKSCSLRRQSWSPSGADLETH